MQQVLPCPAPERTRAPWRTPEVIRRCVRAIVDAATVHADEVAGRWLIDVPSCWGFDPAAAAELER
jgi:hypothetical protein